MNFAIKIVARNCTIKAALRHLFLSLIMFIAGTPSIIAQLTGSFEVRTVDGLQGVYHIGLEKFCVPAAYDNIYATSYVDGTSIKPDIAFRCTDFERDETFVFQTNGSLRYKILKIVYQYNDHRVSIVQAPNHKYGAYNFEKRKILVESIYDTVFLANAIAKKTDLLPDQCTDCTPKRNFDVYLVLIKGNNYSLFNLVTQKHDSSAMLVYYSNYQNNFKTTYDIIKNQEKAYSSKNQFLLFNKIPVLKLFARQFNIVKRNQKYSIIDWNGEPLLPFSYDSIIDQGNYFDLYRAGLKGCYKRMDSYTTNGAYYHFLDEPGNDSIEQVQFLLNPIYIIRTSGKWSIMQAGLSLDSILYDSIKWLFSCAGDYYIGLQLNKKWSIANLTQSHLYPPKFAANRNEMWDYRYPLLFQWDSIYAIGRFCAYGDVQFFGGKNGEKRYLICNDGRAIASGNWDHIAITNDFYLRVKEGKVATWKMETIKVRVPEFTFVQKKANGRYKKTKVYYNRHTNKIERRLSKAVKKYSTKVTMRIICYNLIDFPRGLLWLAKWLPYSRARIVERL